MNQPEPSLLADAELLRVDVESTLGAAASPLVERHVARIVQLAPADATERLVNDVQQEIHDTFTDTSWPTCPRHGTHPLEYHDAAWWCDTDHIRIAPLGSLGA